MLVEDLENFPFCIVFWCFRDPSILLFPRPVNFPEKSEGHVQKTGLDFWFFTQQNQMESVRFREKRKKMFGGEKWRVTGEEVKVPAS
jgi:hypothetical protein